MKDVKIIFILCILFFPLLPNLYTVTDFSLPLEIMSERKKIEIKNNLNQYSYLFNFLNQLKGKVLVMRAPEILNYTHLNILDIYDENFLSNYFLNKTLQGINYAILNNYSEPVMYTPFLESILYDQSKSQLIFDAFGWKVLKLEQVKSPVQPVKFKLFISRMDLPYEYPFYKYVSHKNEFSDLTIMPRVEDGDFPFLEPGLYDYICMMDVEVDRDTLVDLKCHPYFGGEQFFYLAKGKNRILTRFLNTHRPFRLVLTSKNPNIIFHDIDLTYRFHEKLLSPENVLSYEKLKIPLTINPNGEANLKICGTEVLTFEKPFNKGNILEFTAKGYGSLRVLVSPLDLSLTEICYTKLRFLYSWLPLKTLKFFSSRNYEYSLSSESKFIQIPIIKDSYIQIQISSGTFSKKQNFVLSSFSVKRKE